jgi:site-specific DNA-methyltransferase (adenine-specific)
MSYTIHNGDCLNVLAELDENSIDTCITDPPYELGFMGKRWDSSGVAFQVATWEAVYRVLNPGAILLAFGGTRTYHRMVCAIEDAGFEIRDTIAWVYGSGFPKSYDISKGIDKQAGAEREVVGKYKRPDGTDRPNRNNWKKLDGNWGENSGFDPTQDSITAPSTPEAQLWDGWGTALKPAFEPIVVAMKPIDGTFVNNALTWGVAGLWIDGGRVGFQDDADYQESTQKNRHGDFNSNGGIRVPTKGIYHGDNRPPVNYEPSKGRFPANFIHDGSDEVVSGFPNDAQRFFYCAKASRSERNAGLEGMEEKESSVHVPRGKCDKCGKWRNAGEITCSCGGTFNVDKNPTTTNTNHHPTVKPIELMRYLVRLTKTPTGGTVLDPFMGSGTTGCACALEGRDFVGIEREPDYIEIAEKRIEHWAMQPEQLRIE